MNAPGKSEFWTKACLAALQGYATRECSSDAARSAYAAACDLEDILIKMQESEAKEKLAALDVRAAEILAQRWWRNPNGLRIEIVAVDEERRMREAHAQCHKSLGTAHSIDSFDGGWWKPAEKP